MNKKIVSTITIATILLSLIAFLPMSSAVTSNGTAQPNVQKIAPGLITLMAANPMEAEPIIVVLQPGVDQAQAVNAITSLGGTVTAQFHVINAIATTLTADKIEALSSMVSVDQILVDGKKYLPIDPLGDDSGSQPVTGPAGPNYYYAQFPFVIGADQAWSSGINGAGVVVADLDTGIYYQHLDLAGVVTDYKIFTGEADTAIHDGNGHGTATTGLVAAQGILTYYGFLKVMGVAPGAKVIGGKVLTNGGWGWDSWIINGIDWAVASGANIITMSLGGLEIPNNGYDPTCLALEAATKQGVTCFVAAGNSQGAGTVSSAGDAKDIITVGASTDNSGEWNLYGYWPVNPGYVSGYENDQVIFWSSGGATADGRVDPDICAPGAWGETLARSSTAASLQFGGTSMATPVAAGAGALVYQAYKQAHGVFPSPAVVRDILMNTAKDLGLPANRQGAGRVDAYKAVEAALNSAAYSNTDEIAKTLLGGTCYTTSSTFTSTITSAQATWLQYVSTTSFSTSVSGPGSGNTNGGSTWITITIPNGVDYADVRAKFDPVIAYGTPIQSYDGSTWTDVHINTALYKERTEGDPTDLILINYGYAHTNVQWFDARIDFGPGTYVLRFWNAYPTINPVDVQVNFYKFATWSWVSTVVTGNKLLTKMTVPKGTAPGIYSGFVKTTVSGSTIDIPVVITVPATLGKAFSLQANVMNEPRTYSSGDFYYIPVQGFSIGTITLTASWTTSDADFDVFLATSRGEVKAASEALSVPVVKSGGGGYYWHTTTGTTMEVLSTFSWFSGCWYVGIHAMYFGNTFGQTVTLKLAQGSPIDTPWLLSLTKSNPSKTFTVSNDIPGNVNVQVMAMQLATEAYTSSITDTVTSVGGSNVGYNVYGIAVTPDMITMKVTLSWVGSHSLSLMLWDPFGHNAGTINTNGGSITINNPAVGVWAAIPTINDAGSQVFTLTLSGTHFKTYAGVTITPSAFTLAPLGTQTLTISDTPSTPSGLGVIVYYDLTTGSTYSRTLLTVTH
jgi:subtilisin family serine protease